MIRIEYQELSTQAFAPFGTYTPMVDPVATRIGAPPIEFFRDMAQATLGPSQTASFGVCRVQQRPFVIDVSEYHDTCPEVLMPLDGDILMHVAPAVPEKEFPIAAAAVFRVPMATLVILRPGVWHHGPYTLGASRVNSLVMLPERTYANDCKVYVFPKAKRMRIVGPGLPEA